MSPCHLRIADQFCYAYEMIFIISSFSTLLLLSWGAILGARWIFKIVINNRENISNFIYNAYNLPETTFQKVMIGNKYNTK